MSNQPTHHFFDATAAQLSYFEWGDAGAPVIVLAHATGFHARVWDKTISALPEGYRIIAVELRGHGRSPFSEPIDAWRSIATDLGELIDSLALRDAIGVGHSMGAHCMTQVAYDLPTVFKRLLLVDPVISPPIVYEHDRHANFDGPHEHPIASRRSAFDSWQAMRDHFKDRPPYSLWQPAVLEDYCRFGLMPSESGNGYELACAPLVEASVYYFQRHGKIHHLLPEITIPVTVLRAQERSVEEWKTTNFLKSPTWELLADQFPNGRDIYLPKFTHFIPMQSPNLVARFIADGNATLFPSEETRPPLEI